jgi:catechol 2,3-dioxygenase-like lactoylglutathione lyase family enzyme
MKFLPTLLLLATACGAQDLPLTGISHVNFRVSDLEKAREFYTGQLGYQQAFFTGRNGTVGTSYLKVNDDQYIEISPGLKEGEDHRLTHVSFVTTDIEKLHAALTARGLEPTPLRPPGGDGTRGIRVTDPFGFPLEFTEYLPGSEHAKARGKFEDPKRVSVHLMHAGIPVPREKLDAAIAYYRDKLGFKELQRGESILLRVPGPRGDAIELMPYSGTPTREQLGNMQHIALEVAAPRKTLNDPDGSRVEFLEAKPAH